MKQYRNAAIAAFLLCLTAFLYAQEAKVSKKQDVAVFALGYYGYNIPQSVLANVDAEIQGVFVNLGRFNVLGQTERFSSKDVQDFINLIQTAKQNNTPLPEEVKFGEVQLTQALMNKLYGAFVVVIPTIVDFRSEYVNNQYEATMKTSVVFLNVAEGTTMGMANIQTSGASKDSENKAIGEAINGIPVQLTFEVRKIPAFTINTQVLQVNFGDIKMQLGSDMGVKVGDEYVVIQQSQLAGLTDEREDGLVLINNVGPQISTGTILYSGPSLKVGAQLREVPRLGFDVMPYLTYLSYFSPVKGWTLGTWNDPKESTGTLAAGAKFIVSRGFYDLRPLVGLQMNFDTAMWLPVIAYGGLEYNLYFRRVAVTGSAAIAGASNVLIQILQDQLSKSDNQFFTHYGIMADVGASYLVSRDMRIFANVNVQYLFGIASALGGPFQSYGGYGISGGVLFKL